MLEVLAQFQLVQSGTLILEMNGTRNLWADKHLKRVPYSQRRRGDLVFYYQPGTRTIWHIAIYLGNNRVIESWPPCVMVQPIVNGQRNVIAGIKRPFI